MDNFYIFTIQSNINNFGQKVSNAINSIQGCASELIAGSSTNYSGLSFTINDKEYTNDSLFYSSNTAAIHTFTLVVCTIYNNESVSFYDETKGTSSSFNINGGYTLIALNQDDVLCEIYKYTSFGNNNWYQIINISSGDFTQGTTNTVTITKCYTTNFNSCYKNIYINSERCTFTPGTVLTTKSGKEFVSIGSIFFILK